MNAAKYKHEAQASEWFLDTLACASCLYVWMSLIHSVANTKGQRGDLFLSCGGKRLLERCEDSRNCVWNLAWLESRVRRSLHLWPSLALCQLLFNRGAP